ncbi:MAG: peptidase C39 [Selenomonadaceae bacterium]|nr:peptidase C39 [Selenomonadaceae bacterium]MBR0358973.1 peptidase C39 [Selenomonadaceae bacterium]
MAKNPLHYQLTEYDCGPTAMLDAISYLFQREEIPPEIIRNVMLYCLDCYSTEGTPGKSGTSHMAMMFLSNWLKQFSRVGQLPVTSEYIAENQVHLGKGGRLDDILTRGGAAVVRLWLDEWHYVMLSSIKDGMVYMFDPYFRDTPYEDYPQVQVVLHQPFAYNRIVPADMFNTTELSLYALGPVEEREAVLLGNQNTLLTAEKTIEYFI